MSKTQSSLNIHPYGEIELHHQNGARALVLRKLRALGSVRQGFTWLHEEGIELPVTKSVHGQTQLEWHLPT